MTPLYILIFKFLTFQLERIIFNFIQTVLWFCDGTLEQIAEAKDPKNYDNSARLSKVRKCHIFDAWMTYNSPINMITSHQQFVHPEYVLKDEVSLYCVTDSEALFVEAPPGVEVWKSQYSTFHRIAQHEYAVNIISMPLPSFYRLARELGEIKEKLIFLDFVPRSGSTLFGQIFEETGVCVNYSEPSMLNMYLHDFDEDAFKKVLKASVRFYAKPRSSETRAFVLKYAQMGRSLAPILHDLFPDAFFFHLLRNGIPNLKSIIKAQSVVPFGRIVKKCCVLPIFHNYFKKVLIRALGFDVDERYVSLVLSCKKPWYLDPSPWFMIHHNYRQWLQIADFENPCVKYEDLASNPRDNIEILFKRCGLSLQLVEDALGALTKDSQAGSPLDREILKKHSQDHLIDSDYLDYWQQFADLLDFPGWQSDYRLPGTITIPRREQ